MAVGLGVMSGNAAQATTIQPDYACGPVIEFGSGQFVLLLASNCAGPVGTFARGTINTGRVCNISALAQPDGTVYVLAWPYYRCLVPY